MVYYEYMMIMYRNRHNIWLKIIAIAMVCLFFVDTACWAYPDNNPGLNRNTLATQSIFKPLNDAGIHTSAEIEFEIVAGVRLLLASKTPSAVNGILTETYRKSKDKRKIDFLPNIDRSNGKITARFKVIGRENVTFELKYQDTKTKVLDETKRKTSDDTSVPDTGLYEIAPIEKLTYGNVFQENDVIEITKIEARKTAAKPQTGDKRIRPVLPQLESTMEFDKMIQRAEALGISLPTMKAKVKNLTTGFDEEITITPYLNKSHYALLGGLGSRGLFQSTRNSGINDEKGLLLVAESQDRIEGIVYFALNEDIDMSREIFADRNIKEIKQFLSLIGLEVHPDNQYGANNRKFAGIGRLLISAVIQASILSESIEDDQRGNIVLIGTLPTPTSIRDPKEFYASLGMIPFDYHDFPSFYFPTEKSKKLLDTVSSINALQLLSPTHSLGTLLDSPIMANKNLTENYLSAENKYEKYLLAKSSKYLAGHPVNMRIDLTTIPRSGLTKDQQVDQLEQNIETLARMIAWHNMFDLNIRYILEHNTDGAYRDKALAMLKDKLVKLQAIPGIDVSELLLRIGPLHSGDGVIEISLKNLDAIKAIQSIPDNTYYVALKDDIEKSGVPMPNYTAAANMGLSLAALRIAKEKAKEKAEYNELRDKILKVFRSIYKRYDVISEEEKFTADELELMVAGSSDTRLYYAILYALPPIVKAAIEEIRKYHESLHLLLQAV